MLKNNATGGDIDKQLSAGQYLLYSAEASSPSEFSSFCYLLTGHIGAVTAVMTNPLWVVRVRMFTTQADTPGAYSGLWSV
jgi:solute carrier family 25 (mitochondrial folate transporter), member 32